MPQEKNIDLVNITKQIGIDVIDSIFSFKENVDSNNEFNNDQKIYKSEISDIVQIENSVKTIEGELLLLSEENIRYTIDINGDFILEDIVSDRYVINDNGELEYNY